MLKKCAARKEAVLLSIKNLMRFYFSAGSLNAALDRLILRLGLAAGNDYLAGCAAYAERAAKVVEAKGRLAELWARLDGVICGLTERDRLALNKYAAMRGGADGEDKRERHRAAVKFARRAQGLRRGGLDDYKLLCAYLCLISPAPD